jgi:DNA invertase Pin-like site-specific DNA recombinase
MSKRCALYCRVSTPDQHLENQLFQLRELATKRGYTIVKEYTDKMSGAKARRPGLDALMADARHGKFDMVFVAAFDRIARSTRHFLQVLDELESFGIEFASAREAIDTSGAMGRMFLTMIGAISALERDICRDRIRQGMARRRLMGLPCGRQPLDISHEAVAADRLSGLSLTETANRHGISRATVVRFVKEARLRGGSVIENNQQSEEVAA